MSIWQQILVSRSDVIEVDTERDHYMSAEEAKAYGLIDDVISNQLRYKGRGVAHYATPLFRLKQNDVDIVI